MRWTGSRSPKRTSGDGVVYVDFLLAETTQEHERRASLQNRAASLSGFGTGAVGLIATGAAIALGRDPAFSLQVSMLLLVTLLLFIASTALAVVVLAIGQKFQVADTATLSRMVNAGWNDSETTARRAVALLAAKSTVSLRSGNNRSATRLLCAGWLQVAGLTVLVGALLADYSQLAS